jgi:hypothetical protein
MKLLFAILSILITFVFRQSVFAQGNKNFCGHEHDQMQYWKENPAAFEDFQELLKSARSLESANGIKRTKFIIPVVFHVIHNDGVENVDDELIIKQLEVLNKDFQLLNADTSNVDPAFKDLIGNCNFEFRLATIDPKGNCTTGIEHIKSFLTENSSTYSKLNQWNRSKYLNIWVVKSFPPIANGEVLGRAYLPFAANGSLFFADGVTVLAKEIVKSSRTLTHEVGHYLGLQHTFNSVSNDNKTGVDCGDDGISDTPRTKGGAYNSSFTCATGATNAFTGACDINGFSENNDFSGISLNSGKVDTTSIIGKQNKYQLNVLVGNYTTDTTNYINTFPKGARFLFKVRNISAASASKVKIDYTNWKTGAKNADTVTANFSQIVDTTKYYEISYESSKGNSIDIKGLNIVAFRNKEGVRSIAVRASTDNFKSNLNLVSASKFIRNLNNVANIKSDTSVNNDLNFFVQQPQKLTDLRDGQKVTFRVYGWNAETSNGSFGIESLQLIADTSKINMSRFSANGVGNNSKKSDAFAFDSWDTGAADKESNQANLTGNINLNKYYEFSITAKKRKLINIDSITFFANRNNSGIRNLEVRSSVDNFSSPISLTSKNTNVATVSNNRLFFKADTTLGLNVRVSTTNNNYKNIRDNKTITFRIYGFNAETTEGTLEIDSVKTFGIGSTIENFQNYMDYSDCPLMFSRDQVTLMKTILALPISSRNNLHKEENLISTGTNEIKSVVCKPAPYFNYNITHLCSGGLVSFRDKSWSSKATSRVWYFQDGTPSTDTSANPKVVFDTPGYKKVSLHVKNSVGEDSLVLNQAVFVSGEEAEINDLFSQSFNEGSLSNWLVVNEENNFANFQVGTGRWGTKGIKLNNFKDISNATLDDIDNRLYFERLGGSKDALISPSIDFTRITDTKLNFDYSYATTSFYDSLLTEKLVVSYTTNCGRTWLPLHTICYSKDVAQTASYSTDLITAGIYSGKEFIPSSDDVWKTTNIDLTPIVKNASKNRVRIKLEFFASSYSNNLYIDNINLFGTVNIEDNPLTQMNFNIVPNPTSNDNGINVEYVANEKPVMFELIDLQGKVLRTETNYNTNGAISHKINLNSKIKAGYYTLRISQGQYVSNKKLIIQ